MATGNSYSHSATQTLRMQSEFIVRFVAYAKCQWTYGQRCEVRTTHTATSSRIRARVYTCNSDCTILSLVNAFIGK